MRRGTWKKRLCFKEGGRFEEKASSQEVEREGALKKLYLKKS